MNHRIRAFTQEDYPLYFEILRTENPDFDASFEVMQQFEAGKARDGRIGRYIVEDSKGCIVGVGRFIEASGFAPGLYGILMYVKSDAQHKGLGSALYEAMYRDLCARNAKHLRIGVKEDRPASCRFFEKRGFKEMERLWPSILDVGTFDFSLYSGLFDSLKDRGISIQNLTTISRTDPDYVRKLRDLDGDFERDIPFQDTVQSVSVEEFKKRLTIYEPNGEFFLVAVDEQNRYAGSIGSVPDFKRKILATYITGVARDFRNMGVATALKVRSIELAKIHGLSTLTTTNHIRNKSIIGLNIKLGYVRKPATIAFGKEL